MSVLHTQIKSLSSALLALHRHLLRRETKVLEREADRKFSPYELLGMSLNDPRLAWLRTLSGRIVEIDTMLDEIDQPDRAAATRLADEVAALFGPGGNNVFWDKYAAYLAEDTEVILKHSDLKTQLDRLRRQSEN